MVCVRLSHVRMLTQLRRVHKFEILSFPLR